MNTILKPQVQLEVTELRTLEGDYQTLVINLHLEAGERLKPNALGSLELPSELDLSREVILFGKAPIWLYSYLVHCCHSAPWVGCYAMEEQSAVLVHSRVSHKAAGDKVCVPFYRPLCPAILIGGPPDSGKSVLSNALCRSLRRHKPEKNIFLCRAHWDGQGNWTYEMPNRDLACKLVKEYENRLDPQAAELLQRYFDNRAEAVKNIRAVADLVLVDVGGRVQAEKAPVVSQCTHYIIISRDIDAIAQWHDFCRPTLKPLAVIHSVQEQREEPLQKQPVLEMIAGRWEEEETSSVPNELLQEVLRHWTVPEN